jgi:hypothetical protein
VQPEPPATRLVPVAKGVKWGVLRYMQMNKDRRIRVGGVTFELMSDPAMPPAWPTRAQFPRP